MCTATALRDLTPAPQPSASLRCNKRVQVMSVRIVLKSKAALQDKNRATKKKMEQEVALSALAATAPDDLLADMKLELREIATLKGLKKRVRLSQKDQVKRVAKSISKLRQCVPIPIDASGEIIDGHIVVEALKLLGAGKVWCAVIDHLDDDERALLHVALNAIGERGDWDFDALGPLLIEFDELGFDLGTTGFSLPELDIIMAAAVQEDSAAAEKQVPEPPTTPVSVLGDCWILGLHRLRCADATKAEEYELLLQGEPVDVIFTDLPWNIPIAGFVSGLGKVKHQNFKQGVGEMSREEFATFCDSTHELGARHLKQGGVFFSCIDWRSVDIIMRAGKRADLRHIQTIVWNKGSGGMGSPYRSAHEFIVAFCKGKKLATNNVELGKHGRDRTSVWNYPGANRKGSSASKALGMHPTPKPIELVRDAMLDVSNKGGVVLDPFMGSGSTILAAELSGRLARGIELDPAYVDVAVRRWEELTGQRAVHAETNLSFAETAELRLQADEKAYAA